MKIGRIYKITAGKSNECYVGSTFDRLNYRFKGHKINYTNAIKNALLLNHLINMVLKTIKYYSLRSMKLLTENILKFMKHYG